MTDAAALPGQPRDAVRSGPATDAPSTSSRPTPPR